MSRRTAIILTILAIVVFSVVYFWPERAVAGSHATPGVAARLHLGDRAVGLGAASQPVRPEVRPGRGNRDHWGRDRGGHDRHHHGRRDRWNRLPLIVIAPVARTQRVIERETVILPAPPPPVAALPVVAHPVAAAPVAPDPQGRARTVSARGAGARPREWVLGAFLPAALPHVALDAATYGLPPPPPGQIYARVEGEVLRIEAGTRRIVAVLAR